MSLLRSNREMHQLLWKLLPLGVLRVTREGSIVECNPWAESFGFQIGDLVWDRVSGEAREYARGGWSKLWVTGDRLEVQWTREREGVTVHLNSLWIQDREDSSHVWVFIQDETDLRTTEARLGQASKMSALGEMAAVLAHEINNPMTVIHGKAGLIREVIASKYPESEDLLKSAEKIETTALRVAKIVRGLRVFGRDGSRDPFEWVPVHLLIEETLEFCRERFRSRGILLQVEPVPQDLELECRPTQIQQVLLNLLNNAFDAVEGLGRGERWVNVSVELKQEQVVFQVTDSGPGIPAPLREKIMKPFFTTKDAGKGTGLGLSVSRSILHAHQGALSIDANCSNTRFWVSLPQAQEIPLEKIA